jgi:hypothetical protein
LESKKLLSAVEAFQKLEYAFEKYVDQRENYEISMTNRSSLSRFGHF